MGQVHRKAGDRLKEAAHEYCGECRKDFSPGEIVYYTWYENLTFCGKCKRIMNERVTPSYLDWQERVVKGVK